MEGPVVVRVRQVVADYSAVPIEAIMVSTTLESLKYDSLDVVQLSIDLEEEFKITIPIQDVAGFSNLKVGDLVLFIDRLLKVPTE